VKIIDGKKIADQILVDLKKQIKLKKNKPCLAVILVGNEPASRLYVRVKEKAARKIGIGIKKYILSSKASEEEILKNIELLNQDSEINGILVQMPLPKSISTDKVVKAIALEKDVDGFVKGSQFVSPFVSAIWQALLATGEDLDNKKAVALVNSEVFGQALSRFLREKGLTADYVILRALRFAQGQAPPEESREKSNEIASLTLAMTKNADVIITALGQPNVIKGNMIKEKVILIDGGINRIDEKTIGDIDADSVKEKAKWLSPVPGGLGPITVAFLLKNVVLAIGK
jgi:methylenetetrahydrofolate dehydrogenase (NADP+)/methenyltetrahydrofolate cyclohydrolase